MQVNRRCVVLSLVSVLCGAVLAIGQDFPYNVDTEPKRGFLPDSMTGAVDSIDPLVGNLHLDIPIVSLPAGPTGGGFELRLMYTSAIYDISPGVTGSLGTMGPPPGEAEFWQSLTSSPGWSFNIWNYGITQETHIYTQLDDFDDHCEDGLFGWGERPRLYRLRAGLGDGSQHPLYLYGYNDEVSDPKSYAEGFYHYDENGYSECDAPYIGYPNQAPDDLTDVRRTYFTMDGTYAKYEIGPNGADPILYLKDGSRVVFGSPPTLVDPNGNEVSWGNGCLNEGCTEQGFWIRDQYWEEWSDRQITIQTVTGSGPSDYLITGPTGAQWFIDRDYILIDGSELEYGINGNQDTEVLGTQYHTVVTGITVPTDPETYYSFGYNDEEDVGWGELDYMEAPSGAVYEYTYLNQNPRSQEMLVWNPVTSREVTHDGTSDLWEYYHVPNYSYTVAPDDGVTQFVHWGERVSGIYRDDGSYTERGWAENPPPYMSFYEIGSRNPYVSAEWTTVGDDGGDPAKSAVTAFEYDRNGNVTGKIEYPWQTWSMTPQVPSPSTALRTTAMDYFYPSPAIPANPDTTDSAYGYWREHHATYWSDDTDPRRLNAIQRQTVSVTGSTPVSILEYEYDDPYTTGNATSEERWDSEKASSPPSLGNLSTSSAQVITRTYNSLGQVTEIAGAAINTEITYGTIPGGSGPGPYPTLVEYAPGTSEARSFSYEWDYETGLLETKTDEDNDIDTDFTYDDLGRILTVEEAGLRRTETSYDNDDLLVRVESDLASLGDGKLQTVTHYDQLGRVVLTRVTDGSILSTSPTATDGIKSSTIYISASGGNRVVTSTPYRSTSDPTLEWTCTQYDLLGRVTTTAMYTGSTAPTTCTSTTNQTAESGIVYDADRTETTDPAGKVREEYRDGMGRLVQVTEDPSGLDYDTTYSYDVLDNLLTVSQGSQDRTFEYSSLGRLLSADNPETGEIIYTYNDDGTLASKTDARDIAVDYSYDALDRITEKDYSDSTPDVTYTYYTSGTNSVGQPESVSTSAATETFNGYDALGRVTSHTQEIVNNSNDYTMSYTYLLNDAIATMVYPSGREVDYTLDDAGRIRTVDDGTTTFADLDNALGDYDPRGRIARIELGNGLWETRDYRPAGTATELKLGTSSGGSERLKLAYNYDGTGNNGNLASHVITQAGSTTYTQTFTYDGLNRLDEMTETGGFVRDYEYDRYGNRWLNSTNTTGPATYDPHEPTASSNFPNGDNRLSVASSTYDAAGNQTFFTPYTLTYDAENRLTEAESASNGNAYYAYDGNGRRVGKAWTPGGGSQTLTYYIYDITGRLAAEYSDEEPEEGETSYVFSGQLGSVRMLTDASGNINECYDFLPFGRMLTTSDHSRSSVGCYPSSPTSYTSELSEKFTGQQRDEIQLDYFQARYLSAAQGRFSSPDSTGYSNQDNPQSWNLYAYTLNNPLLFVDPDGHDVQLPDCEEGGDAEECQATWQAIRDAVGGGQAGSRLRLTTFAKPQGFLSRLFHLEPKTGYRISILGDVNSFRDLGENASKLADLVEGPTVTAEIATLRPSGQGAMFPTGGGFSDVFGNGPFPGAYLPPDPSGFDRDTLGWIGGTVGRIPGANLAEAMAHELLGHTWGFVIRGFTPGSSASAREAIWAEDQVRRTDPARGLKTHHQNYDLTVEELERLAP